MVMTIKPPPGVTTNAGEASTGVKDIGAVKRLELAMSLLCMSQEFGAFGGREHGRLEDARAAIAEVYGWLMLKQHPNSLFPPL